MGTSTKVKIPAIGKEFTPEECSSEVLRALYGYLPEDIRGETRTVITVLAAFNQMQKDATMQAAKLANWSSSSYARASSSCYECNEK